MRNLKTTCLCSAAMVTAAAGISLVGAKYEVPRYTLTPGGGSQSLGNGYEVFGSIGQPDSGSSMAGGEFEIIGGFLFAIEPADCNADGAVTLADHAAFTSCLSGPAGASPVSDCRCFDVDRNEVVDLRDYADMQLVFSEP